MARNAVSNPGQAIFQRVLGWLPAWLGFGLIVAAGVAAMVVGAISNPASAGLIAFGVAAIASSILAWWAGGKSEPRANPFDKSFGGILSGIDGWVWLVIFGLFVVAVIIAVVV